MRPAYAIVALLTVFGLTVLHEDGTAGPLASPAASLLQPPDVAGTPIERELEILAKQIRDAHDLRLLRGVRAFYAARDFTAAWTDSSGFTSRGRLLHDALREAPAEGLDPLTYVVPMPEDGTPTTLARADVRLSFVSLRFAEDLGWGRVVPGEVDRANAYPRRPFPAESLLTAWVRADDPRTAVLAVTPPMAGYARLRVALRELEALANAWDTVGAGASLRMGAVGPRVLALRRSLAQRGDLPATATGSDTFDIQLAGAVALFQQRHGLSADSIFGAATRVALNVPLAQRVLQVQLGMERARWLPPLTDGRWITVNLADQRVFVLDDGRAVFSTRVVIGATNHKTPMFTDTLTNIVFNPEWNVPPSIAAKEIWPKVRRDPSYLAKNHMVRVPDGIKQLSGPWNALGQVAFMFPNAFNVYMHDTPAKALFEQPDRAHSHGCIRVQHPRELAEVLLSREQWSRAQIDSVIAAGARRVVMLRHRIPVRITYATAFIAADGTLQFRPDVYGRDARLAAYLQRVRAESMP